MFLLGSKAEPDGGSGTSSEAIEGKGKSVEKHHLSEDLATARSVRFDIPNAQPGRSSTSRIPQQLPLTKSQSLPFQIFTQHRLGPIPNSIPISGEATPSPISSAAFAPMPAPVHSVLSYQPHPHPTTSSEEPSPSTLVTRGKPSFMDIMQARALKVANALRLPIRALAADDSTSDDDEESSDEGDDGAGHGAAEDDSSDAEDDGSNSEDDSSDSEDSSSQDAVNQGNETKSAPSVQRTLAALSDSTLPRPWKAKDP